MTLVNWSPLRELDDLFNQYGRLLGRSATPAADRGDGKVVEWRPVANISETADDYIIKAELPEVAKKDIDVSVHEGVITIRGERRLENRTSDEKHHRIESFYGSFARSFTLPADVDETKIQAESKDGVLTVRLPKTEARKPRPIEVQVR
ncbi:MAG: Hsp20/alpha crystallin family protein [Gammaproteobacteria bacterium]|nr:Hsp20/alpha crystallin family protein [Gammaproteobacteria bacterium]